MCQGGQKETSSPTGESCLRKADTSAEVTSFAFVILHSFLKSRFRDVSVLLLANGKPARLAQTLLIPSEYTC